jgi:MoxR-like ATPase
MSDTPFYTGRGDRDPGAADQLPTVSPEDLRDPHGYRATPELAAAVDVALTLGMPLLLTGEPGSGKSGLADSLAWELGLGEVMRFPVKSDTESRDLFYRFDTVGRFHAAQTLKADDPGADAARFLRFEALGRAILLAKSERAGRDLGLPDDILGHPGEPRRSVVLIDEIDKAPRDVPNDILVEIEMMQFDIPELIGVGGTKGERVRVRLDERENRYRPIVIFTSNSEKALPDPFLRRCVFHHLGFPVFKKDLPPGSDTANEQVTVESIVYARLGARFQGHDRSSRQVERAIDFFHALRDGHKGLERLPTLAELLDWLDYLMPKRRPVSEWTALAALTDADSPGNERLRAGITSLLLKKPGDQAKAVELLAKWRRADDVEQQA